ncbi:MAG: serine--tRNA ligase, partial [Pseudomonadota bacterium]
MHDLKYVIEHLGEVQANLSKRRFDLKILDEVLGFNTKRKELISFVEGGKAEVNKLSKEVGGLKKQGLDASELMNKVNSIKSEIEGKNVELEEVTKKQNDLLATIPNLIDSSVPEGESEQQNKEVRRWGEPRKFNFKPKDHTELGESLGMLDFERAVKITGARFVVYRKDLARLERSLINFMLDQHGQNGYEEIIPPLLVNASTMYGTGQLPKFAADLFKLEGKDWYLIPTAEVPVTNMKRDELFPKKEMPLRFCSYTPCFRSEAGSYGKDTRGLIRLHQFNKVELVNIVAAEDSMQAHEDMIDRACSILEMLGLPYRAVVLSSGDIGFSARKCIDLEVWLPGMNTFREISSISNCWDFQARRASIRYRDDDGKPQFAHTLNGSGLAVGRTLVAVLENYQQEDGTIVVPESLRPY